MSPTPIHPVVLSHHHPQFLVVSDKPSWSQSTSPLGWQGAFKVLGLCLHWVLVSHDASVFAWVHSITVGTTPALGGALSKIPAPFQEPLWQSVSWGLDQLHHFVQASPGKRAT
jgi:hypothetical protein